MAIVLVVAWRLATLEHKARPQTAAPPSSTPAASEATAPTIAQYLNLREVCPVLTDHRHSLVVSFTLVNLTSAAVTVAKVEPLLPLGGLRSVGTSIAGGACGRPEAAPAGGVLGSDQTLLVTFHFALPATCPQPLPVQATVRTRAGGSVVSYQMGLLSDLGQVKFDSCRTPG